MFRHINGKSFRSLFALFYTKFNPQIATRNIYSNYCKKEAHSFVKIIPILQLTSFIYNHDLFYDVRTGDYQNLIKNFKSNNIKERHEYGWTLLLTAVANKQKEIVKFLVKNGVDINEIDHYRGDRLMAKDKGVLLDNVRNIRMNSFSSTLNPSINYYGCTALHYAVMNDDREMIEFLVENNADPTIKNAYGYTPMDIAVPSVRSYLDLRKSDFIRRKKKLEREERRKHPLENRLRENIIGQKPAIDLVASTIKRKENGWFSDKHPLVMLFLGSSGIGKTETAKQIAKYLHKEDIKKGFIRIDMSEYQEKHSVARFIGSPPGYIGYEQGGQLTKCLSECPDAVVLFDEVEKAHPDILTVLLQLFDEGRMTDGQGKTVECKSAIFIMTSNVASDVIAEHAESLREANKNSIDHVEIDKEFKENVMKPILKKHFLRDEFLGRINEMVYFMPFTPDELFELVKTELDIWRTIAQKEHNITLTWDDEVVKYLVGGYDIHYGARSIKYEVDRKVVNELSQAHDTGLITKGDQVHLSIVKKPVRDNKTKVFKDIDCINIDVKNKSIWKSLNIK